jgi:hypothetical protein
MWPLPQTKNEYMHVVVHPDHVTCVTFIRENEHLQVRNYHEYHIPIGDMRSLDNITALQGAIDHFITEKKLHFSYVTVVLAPDLLDERLILHSKSDAHLADLLPDYGMHVKYQVQYIGSQEDGFLFYVCGIAHALIMQLQMLHQKLPIHTHHIVSPFYAQMNVYAHVTASAFSRARLVQEIDFDRVCIPIVFSHEVLRRSIKIDVDTACTDQDLVYVWGSLLGVMR